MYFAVWSIVTKAAIALSSGLGLILLSMVDFSSERNNSPEALLLLTLLYCILPVILKIISVRIVWTFSFDENLKKF